MEARRQPTNVFEIGFLKNRNELNGILTYPET